MSGVLFGGALKRILSTNAARMLTVSRGAVSAECRRRTLVTTAQLASRESEMHKISTHNRPTTLDRKLLVLTKAFKSEDDIPEHLPITQINRARDIVRITVSILIMVLFVIAVPFYMSAGRRTRDRGETEWRKSKEWVAKLRKDKLAEEARQKAEEDATASSSS